MLAASKIVNSLAGGEGIPGKVFVSGRLKGDNGPAAKDEAMNPLFMCSSKVKVESIVENGSVGSKNVADKTKMTIMIEG